MFWPLLCSGQKPLKKVFNLNSRFRLISSCSGFMSESLCLIGRYSAEQRLEFPRVRILSWSSGRKKEFHWTMNIFISHGMTTFDLVVVMMRCNKDQFSSIFDLVLSWLGAIKLLSCLGRGAIKLLHLSGVNRGRNKRIRFQAIAPQCRRLYCLYCVKGILRASV